MLPAQAGPAEHYHHPVDIGGGHHINMVCKGQGSPALVFLQGAGGDIFGWFKVWDAAAALTRACVYDRAGFGYSDDPVKPATALNATDELHALLGAAHIAPPIILVGHSLGGLFATVYADRFLSEVAGMVLVDPSLSDQFDHYSNAGVADEKIQAKQALDDMRRCASLARARRLSIADPQKCFEIERTAPAAWRPYLEHESLNPAYYEAGVSELENFLLDARGISRSGREEAAIQRRFGDMPLQVLTAGIAAKDNTKSGADNRSFERHWVEGHEKLARRSTRGAAVTVAGSHHGIAEEKPAAVIKAIRTVVMQARTPR